MIVCIRLNCSVLIVLNTSRFLLPYATLLWLDLGLPIAQFFCFQVQISDLELYENLLWETIAIVDICGVCKSERKI
jgi:hypothetical protein